MPGRLAKESLPLNPAGEEPSQPGRSQVQCALGQDTRPAPLLWKGLCHGSLVQPGARCHSLRTSTASPKPTDTERLALHSPAQSPLQLPAHLSDLWDQVPTSTPWTPDPRVVSSMSESLLPPHCQLRCRHPNLAGGQVLT